MKSSFYTFLLLLFLPALAFGQPDSAASPGMAVNAGFLMGGGAALGVDVEYLFAKNRWGVQAGAGVVSFGAGLSYHLRPRINSPFVSLQYWRQLGSQKYDILGVMYVYRYKKWLQAGAGLGALLSESGEAKAGDVLPMFQAGIFVPVSPPVVKSKLAAALQATKSREKEQHPSRLRQAVYVELLGRTPQLYSVNYDCWFFAGHGGPGASVGVGYIDMFGVAMAMIPVSAYYLVGGGNHHLELGAGATALGNRLTSGAVWYLTGTATLGYRYQSASGLMLRAGFTPIIAVSRGRLLFAPGGGVSLGYAF